MKTAYASACSTIPQTDASFRRSTVVRSFSTAFNKIARLLNNVYLSLLESRVMISNDYDYTHTNAGKRLRPCEFMRVANCVKTTKVTIAVRGNND